MLFLGNRTKSRPSILSFLVVVVLATFTGLDFAIIGSVIILLLLAIEKRQGYAPYFLANLLAATGLMIKSSIGLAAYSAIAVSFLIVLSSRSLKFKRLSLFALISLVIFIFTGLIVFKDLSHFVDFLKGMRMLAGTYSHNLSLYPDNN